MGELPKSSSNPPSSDAWASRRWILATFPPPPTVVAPDYVAVRVCSYLSTQRFGVLRRLCELIMPAGTDFPGALEANTHEFLDFLINSDERRLGLYSFGLDTLDATAVQKFHASFMDIDESQAEQLLAPLLEPWKPTGPANRWEEFLHTAKSDILKATFNSREWAESPTGRRRGGGMGLYCYPLD